MAKYVVNYAFECPCYGRRVVEAASPEGAVIAAQRMFDEGSLINGWQEEPDVGCENHRVTHIEDEGGAAVVGGFSLEEELDVQDPVTLSLRDAIAVAAIQGLATTTNLEGWYDIVASRAYGIADAMLKAREA